MLDEKDLQTIDQKLAQQRKEIMQDMKALLDAEFQTKFNLLAEGIQDIQEKLVPRSRVDDLEEEVKFPEEIHNQAAPEFRRRLVASVTCAGPPAPPRQSG